MRALVATLVALCCTAPAALANPVPADELSLLSGASAFERLCTDCHGWDPSRQYESLYDEDPVDAPDPLFDTDGDEEAEPDLLVLEEEEDDDWPEWADPLPEDLEDEEADLRASLLGDLTSAIDDAYLDDEYAYDWDREEAAPEVAADDELAPLEEVFGENRDGTLERAPGATDLTDPDSFVYGTTEMDLFFNIANGTGPGMPGSMDQLGSEAEVWNLVNYIRSLWGEDWVD